MHESYRLGENRELLGTMLLRKCPITGGCKTTMREDSFYKMCKHHRKLAVVGDLVNRFCLECNGAILPDELDFIRN